MQDLIRWSKRRLFSEGNSISQNPGKGHSLRRELCGSHPDFTSGFYGDWLEGASAVAENPQAGAGGPLLGGRLKPSRGLPGGGGAESGP